MTEQSVYHGLPEERRKNIGEILQRDGKIAVHKIVQEFAVSEDTARRDLKDLEGTGLCKCVYGGAMLLRDSRFAQSRDAGERRGLDVDRKGRLGRVLGGLVEPGQVVFIDAGTTNLAAARHVPDVTGTTVITHDPAIAAALVPFKNIRLISIGGKISRGVGAALDASAMRSIRNLRPDLLLLGSCALDAERGLSAFSYEDAEIKSALVENSRAVATGILNEKLDSSAPYGICALAGIHTLVLESDVPPANLAACRIKVRETIVAR